jgi:hypothetical protein
MLGLGFTALILGVVSYFYPFGPRFNPALLFLLAVLLGLRLAIRRQKIRREQMIKEVPRHPLGISDDD